MAKSFLFDFGEKFSERLRELICDDAKKADSDIKEYASTLLFVFGCESFVACGILGDGKFFVRKKETVDNCDMPGGIFLSDGISGITRSEVLSTVN